MVSLLREELELSALPPRKFSGEDRFMVNDSANFRIMRLCELVVLRVSGNYTELTDTAGARIMVRKSLTHCSERLPAEEFFQASRDTIVNLAHIKKVEIHDARRLRFVMVTGEFIILSKIQTLALRRQHSF